MDSEFKEVEWTPEKIEKFWDFQASNTDTQDNYFSRIFGDGIIRKVKKLIPLNGLFLDMGSGPGFFVQHLKNHKVDFVAMDSSPDSIEELRKKFPEIKAEVGSLHKIPLENQSMDGIFLIEVMEHLGDSYMMEVMKELVRVLKIHGYLIVTVPYNENLKAHHVSCPECNSVFHRVQHLQSYDEEKMSMILKKSGLTPLFVGPTNFRDYGGSWQRRLVGRLKKLPLGLHNPTPHLLAIAKL